MTKMNKSDAGKLGAIMSHIVSRQKIENNKKDYYKTPLTCIVCDNNISYEKRNWTN